MKIKYEKEVIKTLTTFHLCHQTQELKTSVQSHLTTAYKKDMKTLLVECLTIWRSESETERQEMKIHFSNLTNFIRNYYGNYYEFRSMGKLFYYL